MSSTHLLVVLEYDVEVTLGDRGVVLPRPLDPDLPELLEHVEERRLRDVPGDAAQEDLARESHVAEIALGELTGPCARSLVNGFGEEDG